MNIIILGAPGSGKGTQATIIARDFHLAHISGGEALRHEVESGSRKGEILGHIMEKGNLVPFDAISSLIEPELLAHRDGFILDGSPRDLVQAEYLDKFLLDNNIQIDLVIYLSVPEEKLVDRLLGRAKLEGRADDALQSIKERFVVFHQNTEPVIQHYADKKLLSRVNGDRSIQEIADNLHQLVASYDH